MVGISCVFFILSLEHTNYADTRFGERPRQQDVPEGIFYFNLACNLHLRSLVLRALYHANINNLFLVHNGCIQIVSDQDIPMVRSTDHPNAQPVQIHNSIVHERSLKMRYHNALPIFINVRQTNPRHVAIRCVDKPNSDQTIDRHDDRHLDLFERHSDVLTESNVAIRTQ